MFANLSCNQLLFYLLLALAAHTAWKCMHCKESYSAVRTRHTQGNDITRMCQYTDGSYCPQNGVADPEENYHIPYVNSQGDMGQAGCSDGTC